MERGAEDTREALPDLYVFNSVTPAQHRLFLTARSLCNNAEDMEE